MVHIVKDALDQLQVRDPLPFASPRCAGANHHRRDHTKFASPGPYFFASCACGLMNRQDRLGQTSPVHEVRQKRDMYSTQRQR
jgi:hypothetical protein